MRPTRCNWLVLLLVCVGLATPAVAQTGGISGKVTDKLAGRGVPSANVLVNNAAGRQVASATTQTDGSYRIAGLAAGTYSVQVLALGYQSIRVAGIAVAAGATKTVDVALETRLVQLEALTTTVSRQEEKITVAPAQLSVVQSEEISDRPALTVTDHVKTLPGVDASQGGLVQANVVGRGFNNIFSGALLMLIDNRFAAVPSLRVNVPAFFTATDQDIAKAEFVLGPGAALYGPNSSNGVLAITTKSPFDSKGTIFALESGYRADSRARCTDPGQPDCSGNNSNGYGYGGLDGGEGFWRLGFRHAGAGTKIGYKLSGEYLKGTEWRMRDPAEPATLTGPKDLTCDPRFGCRDFNVEKWNFDGRVDYRASDKATVTANFGMSNATNLIEYTGIGAGQARNWGYKYGQVRFRMDKLFVQAFANFSDAGNTDANDGTGTFLLRDGNPIVDNSRVWAAQIQHSADLGSIETLTYGVDYAYTDARTGGTINGRNEDNDNITEVGGYLHSMTRITPKLDLVAALRADKHSALADINWSPRAALVFKPTDDQALRVSYNRAFSTPSNNNLFLDIVAGQIPIIPGLVSYKVRALGVPETGFSFRGYCGSGGVDNLCMRTPYPSSIFPGTPTTAFPAQAAPLWPIASNLVAQGLLRPGVLPPSLAPFAGDIAAVLVGTPTPTPAQVKTQLRRLDPSAGIFNNVDSSAVQDIPDLKPTISNVLEVGYKATIRQKLRIDLAGWRERRENFVGPLLVESPNVFLDLATTGTYLGTTFAPALVQRLMTKYGMSQAQAGAIAAGITPTIAGGMAGLSGSKTAPGVPLGTVVPSDSTLTNAPDVFLTYRNFGAVTLWGLDLSVTYLIGNRWSVAGAYSHVNKDFFTKDEIDTSDGSPAPTDIALNAPRNKGALSVQYAAGHEGLAAELRGRYVAGFPINSGVYVTPLNPDGTRQKINCKIEATVDTQTDCGYVVMDATGSYRFKWGFVASLSISNLFNKSYQTFAGLPYMGRMVQTRLSYSF